MAECLRLASFSGAQARGDLHCPLAGRVCCSLFPRRWGGGPSDTCVHLVFGRKTCSADIGKVSVSNNVGAQKRSVSNRVVCVVGEPVEGDTR